jgi:hypothetical protein
MPLDPSTFPIGVPRDSSTNPIQKPIPNSEVPDPNAYLEQQLLRIQPQVDKTNDAYLTLWRNACSTWYQAALDAKQTGRHYNIPKPTLRYGTIILHTVFAPDDPTIILTDALPYGQETDAGWLYVWQRDDGGPLGDPCPDLPVDPVPNTPNIQGPPDLIDQNMYHIGPGDTVPFWVQGKRAQVTVIASGIPGPFQQLTSQLVPVGVYVKWQTPFGGYYEKT